MVCVLFYGTASEKYANNGNDNNSDSPVFLIF